jgi:hypothetical protein
VRARSDDGVHFTPEGGDHLARAIMSFLEPQCSLLAQAVPGMPKKVIETEGSTKVPGTSREEEEEDDTTPTTSRPTTSRPTTSRPATDTTAPPMSTAPPVTEPPTTAAPTTLPTTTPDSSP